MSKTSKLKKAIFQTICYADIFDYPLTLKEIHLWLISPNVKNVTEKKIKEVVKKTPFLQKTDEYFHLNDRSNVALLRKNRQRYSKTKLKIAKRVGKWLKLVPTIKAIAVTGALAMDNAVKDDDIDMMIITKKNRLWLTRLMVIGIVSLVAKRRTPINAIANLKKFKDHICINLYLDESALSIPKSKQNLYIAHEVVQTKFLWSRNKTKEKFLAQNSWISDYLPNIYTPNNQKPKVKSQKLKVNFLEKIAYELQLLYMKPKMTNEQVSPNFAFFHPRNTEKIILNKYQFLLKHFGKNIKL